MTKAEDPFTEVVIERPRKTPGEGILSEVEIVDTLAMLVAAGLMVTARSGSEYRRGQCEMATAFIKGFQQADRKLDIGPFSEKYLAPAAEDILKALNSRPGEIETFALPLPDGVNWSLRAEVRGVSVRLVQSYDMVTDGWFTRADVAYRPILQGA